MTDREPGSADGDDNELSVKLAKVPEGLDAPFDVVMKAGEIRFRHPPHCAARIPTRPRSPRDRAVGNVFHTWASQEQQRRRPGAGKCQRTALVLPFE